jgi:hypothetical protein
MPSNTSSAAVLYTPRLGSHPKSSDASSGEIPRQTPTVATSAGAATILGRGLTRVFSALVDFAEIVVVAWAFPLVILAIGIPVALLVRLVIWTVRALSGW